MSSKTTFEIEDRSMAPFFEKQKISIERGNGVYVWDEEGNRYLDFTSGWGVTCIGHAHPIITEALLKQGQKIIQNPNSGLTYSPARARLLSLMHEILPKNLTHIFFTNSGAEANDAAIKLARKVTGRLDVISTHQSFHGRTISTTSATGQAKHRDKFSPLMPNYRFISYNNPEELQKTLNESVAAVILEPIQGEGGVRLPSKDYLLEVKRMCDKNESLLILDEIQTGFCRTGPMFVACELGVKADFLTMAKGIAGGFPFGAFAMSKRVTEKLELGDHGGTYCGNPLGCAVAYSVIKYLVENRISANVKRMGCLALERLSELKTTYPNAIVDIRGKGLLLLIEFRNEKTARLVESSCLSKGLFVRQTQDTGIRIFPALNINKEEMEEGLSILRESIKALIDESPIPHPTVPPVKKSRSKEL
jgi:acetylornithine/N-succinyldiaminopimelate aminotransferase